MHSSSFDHIIPAMYTHNCLCYYVSLTQVLYKFLFLHLNSFGPNFNWHQNEVVLIFLKIKKITNNDIKNWLTLSYQQIKIKEIWWNAHVRLDPDLNCYCFNEISLLVIEAREKRVLNVCGDVHKTLLCRTTRRGSTCVHIFFNIMKEKLVFIVKATVKKKYL